MNESTSPKGVTQEAMRVERAGANEPVPSGAGGGSAACLAPRSLLGWSPPDLEADTRVKRFVDRALPRSGAQGVPYLVAVIALLNVGPRLAGPAGPCWPCSRSWGSPWG